jgi:hypothetical protein
MPGRSRPHTRDLDAAVLVTIGTRGITAIWTASGSSDESTPLDGRSSVDGGSLRKGKTATQGPDLEQLRKENRELRKECESLKEAVALYTSILPKTTKTSPQSGESMHEHGTASAKLSIRVPCGPRAVCRTQTCTNRHYRSREGQPEILFLGCEVASPY